MRLTTDHTFHIGEQHCRTGKPNQDYVLSGCLNGGLAYAIVSDGCSSGGMTDIGSRLMVLATKRAIEKYAQSEIWLQQDDAVNRVNLLRDIYLEVYRESLGLEYEDLLATCLFVVSDGKFALVHATGDGMVYVKREQSIETHHLKWNQNAPYYPAYKLANLDDQFKKAHLISNTPFTYTKGGAEEIISLEEVNVGMAGQTIMIESEADNGITAIGLFSDGVEQVEGFSYQEVVDQLMAFKSTNGQFAVRRMNRFLKEATAIGRGPLDDISYAVIHVSKTDN